MSAEPRPEDTPPATPPLGRPRRRRGEGGQGRAPYTRPELVGIAAEVFNERGYDAASMEDLSRAAGITKSSFYHHVPGKEALLHAALERALDGLFGILSEPAAREGAPVACLRHIVRRQVEVLATELPYVTLLLRLRGNSPTERWALDRRREYDRALADLVGRAVDAGELSSGLDPATASRLLSGTVNSLIEWYRPGRVPVTELADAVERFAFDGLRGP